MDRRAFIASGLALATTTRAAIAQSGPLTKIIFPFAAGGSGDLTCRVLAEHLAPLLGRHIIVENRTGGDGLIAIKSVMNAPPDGATILITTGPTMYLLPMVETKPSFDQARDFTPVSLRALAPAAGLAHSQGRGYFSVPRSNRRRPSDTRAGPDRH